MIRLLFFLIFLGVGVARADPDGGVDQADGLEEYLKDRFYWSPRLAARAIGYLPIVKRWADKTGLDPYLIATVISYESSWNYKALGKLEEFGLMQAHGRAARGFDLSTPEGQVGAGATWLAKGLKACKGSILGALSFYQTKGKCKPIGSARRRLDHYTDAVNTYRKGARNGRPVDRAN